MIKIVLTGVSDNNLGTMIHLNDQQANQAITSGLIGYIMEQFWFISWLNL
jgi:hypothetical protein